MNKKLIIFFVGDSGCGKTTLAQELVKSDPEKYYQIVSTVTRPLRENEVDGVDYHHIEDPRDFVSDLMANKFVQAVNFDGNHYGTRVDEYIRVKEVGIFICTADGILDTIEGIRENKGLTTDMYEFRIVFFSTTKQVQKERGIALDRIARGDITNDFFKRYIDDNFADIPTMFLHNHHVTAPVLMAHKLDIHTRHELIEMRKNKGIQRAKFFWEEY